MTSILNQSSLAETTVVVTGATGAIGQAIASNAIANGAFVIACGRDRDKLEHLREEHTDHVHTLCYDVTDSNATVDAFKNIQKGVSGEKWPALYGLVNGAGVMAEERRGHAAVELLVVHQRHGRFQNLLPHSEFPVYRTLTLVDRINVTIFGCDV